MLHTPDALDIDVEAQPPELLTPGDPFGDPAAGSVIADHFYGIRVGRAVIVGGVTELRATLTAALALLPEEDWRGSQAPAFVARAAEYAAMVERASHDEPHDR